MPGASWVLLDSAGAATCSATSLAIPRHRGSLLVLRVQQRLVPLPQLLQRLKTIRHRIRFLKDFFRRHRHELMHESLPRAAWKEGQGRLKVIAPALIVVGMDKSLPPGGEYLLRLNIDDLDLFHVPLAGVAPRITHQADRFHVCIRSTVTKDRDPFRPFKPSLQPFPFVNNELALVVVFVGHRIEQWCRYELFAGGFRAHSHRASSLVLYGISDGYA